MKHTVKVDNRSMGKLKVGFTVGIDKDDQLKFLTFGKLSTPLAMEMMISTLYDLMHVPLKHGVPKEDIYDLVVEHFSLMVDKFLPEKAELHPEVARAMLDAEEETVRKLAEEKRNEEDIPKA